MTPDFLEGLLMSRPVLAHDIKVLRGRTDITGAFLRLVRVTGQVMIILDTEQIRHRWSTGRFGLSIPAHAAAERLESPRSTDTTAHFVVLSPNAEWVSLCPRGSVPHVMVEAGTVTEHPSRCELHLRAGKSGGLAFVCWEAQPNDR